MKYVGYHRTSTKEQHLERGIKAIQEYCRTAGIALYKDKVYTDQKTGRTFDRPKYLIVKEELLEPGDALIVSELDRLGRNKEDTLKELRYFKENEIRVMILEIPTTLMDYSSLEHSLSAMLMETVNNMLLEMYAAFAQAEMEKREQRQKEGIEVMKERGEWERYGRPKKMSLEQFAREYRAVALKEMRPVDFRREKGFTVGTYYRYKREYEETVRKTLLEKCREVKKMEVSMTEKEIEERLADIAASVEQEGFIMTEEEKENGRRILRGEA